MRGVKFLNGRIVGLVIGAAESGLHSLHWCRGKLLWPDGAGA